MAPFFYQIHLNSCPKTIEVQDYKLNRKTHRFETFRNPHAEPCKVERYDRLLAERNKHYEEEYDDYADNEDD